MYDFSCIDFETANNNMNSACSVGIVAVSDGCIVKSDYFLIKPPTDHFRHENVEIHGITFDMVMDSPQFPDVLEKLLPYFNDSQYIIAHNARFDVSVLHETAATYNLTIPDFTYMDSISISAKMRKGCGNSLEECAKFFDIPIEHHHNALDDAKVCAEIVIHSVNASRYRNIHTYVSQFSSIKQRKYSELKVKKSMFAKSFSNVKISELSSNVTDFNSSHPLYGKNCVLTGELESMDRKTAMQKILDVGGVVKSAVSSKTHYLIVGTQDKSLVGSDGLSQKEEKAFELINNGVLIKIIKESEFLSLLNYNK